MKTRDLISLLELKPVSGSTGFDKDITGAYASDLLSDVIGSAREGNIWITLQTHVNIVAVASLKDLAGVIIVKGQNVDEQTIEKSNSEQIPILLSEADTFTVAGKLFELLKEK
jgi:predicted transcriptional regulator